MTRKLVWDSHAAERASATPEAAGMMERPPARVSARDAVVNAFPDIAEDAGAVRNWIGADASPEAVRAAITYLWRG